MSCLDTEIRKLPDLDFGRQGGLACHVDSYGVMNSVTGPMTTKTKTLAIVHPGIRAFCEVVESDDVIVSATVPVDRVSGILSASEVWEARQQKGVRAPLLVLLIGLPYQEQLRWIGVGMIVTCVDASGAPVMAWDDKVPYLSDVPGLHGLLSMLAALRPEPGAGTGWAP